MALTTGKESGGDVSRAAATNPDRGIPPQSKKALRAAGCGGFALAAAVLLILSRCHQPDLRDLENRQARNSDNVTEVRDPSNNTTMLAGKNETVDLGSGVTLDLVWVPPGEYLMGSNTSPKEPALTHSGEFGAANVDGEQPQHAVRISQGFWIGKYEVTQAQWERVMVSNPSKFPEERCPVDSVSWQDCQSFVERLSDLTRQSFRMPTEVEWEYACRAGSTTEFSFGDDPDELGRYAWYVENRDYKPHAVGDKLPNAWGICDMHGNVSEWCQDWLGDYSAEAATDPRGPQDGQYRVLRGGVWSDVAALCRSASRQGGIPNQGNVATGLRVVRDW